MLKHTRISRCFFLSLALTISLLFAFVPVALVTTHAQSPSLHLFGPKQHYLALGDSLAYGFQPCLLTKPPTCSVDDGYVPDLFKILQSEGTKDVTNLGCPGETSTTLIKGGICSYSPASSQLTAAVAFLQNNAGKVSPVTLDIGANDVLRDTTVNPDGSCTIDQNGFSNDLATLDTNLTGTILPDLRAALTVKGRVTGSIVVMNYYDPLQNICSNTVPDTQVLNSHLAADVSGFGTIVDVFTAFGGAGVPNLNICTYTWFTLGCPNIPQSQQTSDIHATSLGYSVIANTFAAAIPPN
jgi:lysophospholipase L1-like esterase